MSTPFRTPTGKRGRGVPARDRCCACSNSGWFRFRDGRTVPCTNCPHGWRVDTISRPGGHSAKNAHRAGAPNHQLGSGETPMVGTTPADVPTVAHLQRHLMANTHGWLTSYPHTSVSYTALAALVHQLITDHTTELHQQRAALWELLKDRVRAVLQVCRENNDLHIEWWDLSADNTRLLRDLSVARHERDHAARESATRETEILDLIHERDALTARLSAVDTTAAGEVRR